MRKQTMISVARVGLCVAAVLLASALPRHLNAEQLPRAKVVLANALAVDLRAQTVTVPLYRGTSRGRTVWYIVTDSSEQEEATKRGAVYAPKLAEMVEACGSCVQMVHENDGGIDFNAAPDFSPERRFQPGPMGFPPSVAAPGSIGAEAYSPFVRIAGQTAIINAPIVADGNGPFDVVTHTNTLDRVLAIDATKMTATLLISRGFANGKQVVYISTEASDPGVASMERATFAPALSGATEGTIPVFAVANGPMDDRGAPQGFAFAALRGRLSLDATLQNSGSLRSPMNVLGSFPTGADPESYTPVWSAHVGVWTVAAVSDHANVQLRSPQDFTAAADAGKLTGPDGKPFGAIGVIVNREVVAYIDDAP
jgi:hypothetical protein